MAPVLSISLRNIIIDPVRVSSEENILADAASRRQQVQDWSLSQDLCQKMFDRWGLPGVDLMATVMSRKVPMYFAWSRTDPEAWGLDSLARDVNWTQFNLPYCFPPFPLLGQVLSKVRDQGVERMILVVPWWPTKVWFSTLLSMLLDCRRFRLVLTHFGDGIINIALGTRLQWSGICQQVYLPWM